MSSKCRARRPLQATSGYFIQNFTRLGPHSKESRALANVHLQLRSRKTQGDRTAGRVHVEKNKCFESTHRIA
eukprot:66773-Karenia_brevis.AAC.1